MGNTPCCVKDERESNEYDFINNPASLLKCRRCLRFLKTDVVELTPVLVRLKDMPPYCCIICNDCYKTYYRAGDNELSLSVSILK